MRPEVFFSGKTRGRGTLTLRGGEARPFTVESEGRNQPDGTFSVDQVIAFDDGKIDRRTWQVHRAGANTYAGTLSDASGDMHGKVEGNVFHLRYKLRAPAVYVEQWLYLQRDGETVVNRGEITVLGIPWGLLEERIVRETRVTGSAGSLQFN